MKKLFLILIVASCVSVLGDTPIKDLRVTNSETLKNGATLTQETGSKVIPRATVVISASAIDWRVGNSFSKTLGANTTFTFSNDADGNTIVVALLNTASNYTVTWPTVKWTGNVAPTQTVGAKVDVYTFTKIGSIIYGSVIQNFPP